jgi:hypothetical protein
MAKRRNQKHLTVLLDEELLKKFTIACVKEGKTKTEVIKGFIKRYIDKS